MLRCRRGRGPLHRWEAEHQTPKRPPYIQEGPPAPAWMLTVVASTHLSANNPGWAQEGAPSRPLLHSQGSASAPQSILDLKSVVLSFRAVQSPRAPHPRSAAPTYLPPQQTLTEHLLWSGTVSSPLSQRQTRQPKAALSELSALVTESQAGHGS
jgi:hypothetical protein